MIEFDYPMLAALRKNVGTLRQSGHNIIFATIAVRALQDHEEYVAPQIVTECGERV